MEEKEKGSKGGSGERWKGAIANLTEMTSNLDSLQKLLLKKAVFVNEETFSKASLTSEQARSALSRLCLHKAISLVIGISRKVMLFELITTMFAECCLVLEQRVETLERELDAAISAAAHALAEKPSGRGSTKGC
ncbi:hypothetical protein Peur_031534 [Populus x canadensis]